MNKIIFIIALMVLFIVPAALSVSYVSCVITCSEPENQHLDMCKSECGRKDHRPEGKSTPESTPEPESTQEMAKDYTLSENEKFLVAVIMVVVVYVTLRLFNQSRKRRRRW